MNDDILLTREQIGQALEYAYLDNALSKVHKRHHDRHDSLSVVVKLASTDGKEYNQPFILKEGLWRFTDGALNQQLTCSWIKYGMYSRHTDIMN